MASASTEWAALPHTYDRPAGIHASPSPIPSSNFEALSNNGQYPPDASGAVGTSHIVVAANGTVNISNRNGGLISAVTLNNFWPAAFNLNRDSQHPRVVYDQYGGRFILAARGSHCSNVQNSDGTTSCKTDHYYMLLAASKSADPTGGWWQFQVDINNTSYDPDFVVLGFNKNWIAAGINLSAWSPFGTTYNGSPLWVFNKADVYAGNTATVSTKLSRSDGIEYQLNPAVTLDASVEALYVMQESSTSSGTLRVLQVTGAYGAEQLVPVGTASSGTSWSGSSIIADPQAPQPTSSSVGNIQVRDSRLMNVVYRGGSLWTAHTIFPSGRTAVQWWQVNASTGATIQRGRLDDSTGTTSYALPSIAVNSANDAMLGYSTFSPTGYASAGYSFRQSTDPAGTMRDTSTLKAGAGTYDRSIVFFFLILPNWWGEYSSTMVDPTDDRSLWTMQEYATSGNKWGMWWGKIHPSVPVLTSPGNQTVAEQSTLTVQLSATDEDNDPITYSGSNLPAGATVSSSGLFNWTPSYVQAGTYNITLTATDNTLLYDSKTITITVTNVYDPPVLTPIGSKHGAENALMQFTVSATDPQTHPLTYSVSGLPSGAAFDTSTHVFTWTPGFAQSGTYNVTFSVADDIPLIPATTETVAIIIDNTNRAPSISPLGDRSVSEGTPITFTVSGSDPDGDPITFGATGLPAGATLNSSTGAFSWTPTYSQAGTYLTVFSVTDSGGLTAIWNVTFTIADVNRPPAIAPIGVQTGTEGQNLSFFVDASDPDSDPLTVTATGLPAGASFSQAAGFSWTPDYSQAGTYSVTFRAQDPGGLFNTATITITISNVNRAPALNAVPDQQGAEGALLTFGLTASDPDGDSLTYSATGLPSGASFDTATGQFSWTPGYTNAGSYTVSFKVTDAGGLTAVQSATIAIANTNRAPTFDPIDAQQVDEKQALTFAVTAADPDGQAVTLSVVGLPTGAVFDADTGAFSWTPTVGQSGVYNVTFKATDPEGLAGTQRVTITVVGTNRAPVLDAISPISISAGRVLTFAALASDPNADPLTFSAQNLPSGASLDARTGTFTWPTMPSQVGSYSVTIVVTDTGGLSDSKTVSITLVTNQPPTIASIPPLFGDEGAPLLYTVLASDPNGDPLAYTADNLPDGATFDVATHTLRWTPSFEQAGQYTLSFSVTDSIDSISTITTITIANVNRAPVFSIIPPHTVMEGADLIFSVVAGDPDGDIITYSVGGVPDGAVFDASARTFRWRPGYQQAGPYSVTFIATDPAGAFATTTTAITVINANGPPTIDPIGTQYGMEGSLLSFFVTASDPDNDSILLTASGLPSGATFDANARSFAWTPGYTQAGNYTVTFKATDTGALFSTMTVNLVILNTDRSPVLDPISPRSGAEASLLTFTVHATDPDGDVLTLSATNLPEGATFNTGAGTFAWTPTYGQAGPYTVTFNVSDGTLSATQDVSIMIAHTNRGPTLSPVGTQNGAEGALLSFPLVASDPDGDVLLYSATGLPAGATLDTATGQFSWTPDYSGAGSYTVTWRVSDPTGLSSSVSSTIIIANTNRAPIVDPVDSHELSELQTISFAVTASDPDGDTVVLSALALPSGATFDPVTGNFAWTPGYGQAGIYSLTFKGTDTAGASGTMQVRVTVLGTNGAPLLYEIAPITIAAGRTISFLALATDPNNDVISFSARNLPAGATFDANTGAFNWSTTAAQVGTYGVTITATDPGGLHDSAIASITLVPNQTPVFGVVPAQTAAERQPISFQVNATDAEGDTLTYTAQNLPSGANFDRTTHLFRWTPSYDQAGDYDVTFTVSDGLASASMHVSIVISNVNRRPVLLPLTAQAGAEGTLLTVTVQATDPDNDSLTFSAAGLPTGAFLNSSTHVFTWTPGYDQAGNYDVTFTVSDPDGLTAQQVVSISIADTNRPPVFNTISQQTGVEGATLTIHVTGADPDGDELTYSATSLPAGASFDGSTQTFEWTPTFDQAGTYSVTFTATDGGGLTATRTASLVIANLNRPPTFDPVTAQHGTEGMALTFTVHATDPDGDAVTYALQQAPTGATIDASTGAFAWTPGFSAAGEHTAIISASDSSSGNTTLTVSLLIGDTARAPILTATTAQTGAEGSLLTFTVMATDPDARSLTFSAQNLPPGAAFSATTGTFTWTPDFDQAGDYTILVTVSNTASLTASASIAITITNTNRAPVINPVADLSGMVAQPLGFTVTGQDPDGDTLTWSAGSLPAGASFDPLTQTFAWTPALTQGGSVVVTISASDGVLTTSQTINISVASGAHAPVFAALPEEFTAPAGKELRFSVSATDPDGDTVTLTVGNLPERATFDALSGVVLWTPQTSDNGDHEVTFTATDSTGLTSQVSTTLKVTSTTVKHGCQCGLSTDTSTLMLLGMLALIRRKHRREHLLDAWST